MNKFFIEVNYERQSFWVNDREKKRERNWRKCNAIFVFKKYLLAKIKFEEFVTQVFVGWKIIKSVSIDIFVQSNAVEK